MKVFSGAFHYARVLNIDVCIGVVGSGMLATSLLRANMRPVWWVLLPAAAWVVYTTQSLFDAIKFGRDLTNIRLQFHREHFKVLVVVAGVVVAAWIVIAAFFRSEIAWKGGLFLCSLAALRWILLSWDKMAVGREVTAAIIYSSGVWCGPFLRKGCALSWIQYTGFSLFMLAMLLNKLMNSIMEYEPRRLQAPVSALRALSPQRVRMLVMLLSWFASLGILAFLKYGVKHRIDLRFLVGFCFLFILCAVPGIIISEESFYKKNQRYHFFAEWVFFLGIFLGFIPDYP
ncbi:MAG: hypothetical protein U1F27_01085 [Turneriella sp.]